MKCYHCGKTILFGRSHTHHRGVAGGRWKKRAPKTQRVFKPNLQVFKILEDDKVKRVRLCTKCLKRIKKDIKDDKKPFLRVLKFQPVVIASRTKQSQQKQIAASPHSLQ